MTAKVTVKLPKIVIKNPSKRFWQGEGLTAAKDIRKRTESRGVDVDGKGFDQYSTGYAKKRQKMGRSTRPNLSLSSRMLGALGSGVRATTDGFKIILSGREGFKAWANEQNGRDFFGLAKLQKDAIFRRFTASYSKTNKLKKR